MKAAVGTCGFIYTQVAVGRRDVRDKSRRVFGESEFGRRAKSIHIDELICLGDIDPIRA